MTKILHAIALVCFMNVGGYSQRNDFTIYNDTLILEFWTNTDWRELNTINFDDVRVLSVYGNGIKDSMDWSKFGSIRDLELTEVNSVNEIEIHSQFPFLERLAVYSPVRSKISYRNLHDLIYLKELSIADIQFPNTLSDIRLPSIKVLNVGGNECLDFFLKNLDRLIPTDLNVLSIRAGKSKIAQELLNSYFRSRKCDRLLVHSCGAIEIFSNFRFKVLITDRIPRHIHELAVEKPVIVLNLLHPHMKRAIRQIHDLQWNSKIVVSLQGLIRGCLSQPSSDSFSEVLEFFVITNRAYGCKSLPYKEISFQDWNIYLNKL